MFSPFLLFLLLVSWTEYRIKIFVDFCLEGLEKLFVDHHMSKKCGAISVLVQSARSKLLLKRKMQPGPDLIMSSKTFGRGRKDATEIFECKSHIFIQNEWSWS